MFCSKCGTQLPEGTAFCTECGTRLGQAAPQPAPQPAPAPRRAAPAAPHKKGPVKNDKLVLITTVICLVLIVCSIVSALNTPFYKMPCLSLLLTIGAEGEDTDELVDEMLDSLDDAIDEMEDDLDYLEDELDDDEIEMAEKTIKAMEKLHDNFSINNFRALVKLAEKVEDEFDVGMNEDEFDEINSIMGAIVGVVIAFFVLPVLFVVLGGLKKSAGLTIAAVVLTAISQLIFCGLLWVVLSLVVGIFQVRVCNQLKSAGAHA